MDDNEFKGFEPPTQNYSKLPNQLIEALPKFSSEGELKVVLYILRHTWGYQEFGIAKKITLDEFMHGRKTGNLKDYPTGRMDDGVGMSKDAILRGLKRAEKHGFIEIEVDDSDKARIKKYYVLRMSESQTPDSDVRKSDPEVSEPDSQVRESDNSSMEIRQRSEKETLERNSQKETEKEPPVFPEKKEQTDEKKNHSLPDTLCVGLDIREDEVSDTSEHIADRRDEHDANCGSAADPVVARIVAQTETRPGPLEVAARTASARAEAGGNPSVPPSAGGSFALGDKLITVACARLGRSEPQGDKRKSARTFFEKALKAEGLLQGDQAMLAKAVQDWLDPEGDYAFYLPQYDLSTKHELALRHFGIVLSKAKVQGIATDTRRARAIETTEASQAAFEERRAAKSPPVKDDKVGGAVKRELALQMAKGTFDTYVSPVAMVQRNSILYVTAPNAFIRDWLENRLATTIRRAAIGVVGGQVDVEFEVET